LQSTAYKSILSPRSKIYSNKSSLSCKMLDIADFWAQDLENLDHDKLLHAAKTFKKALQACQSGNLKLEDDLKRIQADRNYDVSQRVSSFPLSTSSTEAPPLWIRAELDCPAETTWFCFRRRSKYPTVIVYDPSSSSLQARSQNSLKGEADPNSVPWSQNGLLRK
jgi:hypothetical protein